MKVLLFHYHLMFRMDNPVSRHHFTLRCIPKSDERQKILQLQRFIFPCDFLRESRDQWGNDLLYGSYRRNHSRFEANISGQAVTGLSVCTPAGPPEKERIFRFATPLTEPDASLRAFSASLGIQSGAPQEMETVMQAVHNALSYEPGTTTVRTTAAQAFALRHGVCQDYAHVMLAVLRAAGIPSRYAAGMLQGEGESHAWVEVLHRGNWYAYDPTNCVTVSDQHIKLSHGRDSDDCAINRGVFFGAGGQQTEISVIVTENC
ncbi:MAG: hypothetical protein IJJ25_03930 [Lachnospiraceae bacterium]|nr:hypothetical protein [Lachnospiraceae bacterium]